MSVRADYLHALVVATTGDRALGIQAGQLAAAARWSQAEYSSPPGILATGPRSSLAALVASALEGKAVSGLTLNGSLASLKEVIEQNKTVDQMAEVFCFGLLEAFDVKQLAALSRAPVVFQGATARMKTELVGLKGLYAALGVDFEPLR